MDAQSFVKQSLASAMSMLGGEAVTIGSETASGVLSESTASSDIMEAATGTARTLRASFPAGTFAATLKPGMRTTARGESWKISSIEAGAGVLTLTLEDVNHRDK